MTIQSVALVALLAACETPLDVDPTDRIDSGDALNNARAVELATNGAYSALQSGSLYNRELLVYPEMYADNLDFTGTFGTDQQVWQRNIFPTNGAILGAWQDSYVGINRVNNVLAAIPEVADLSAADADRLRGEALFLRALNYLNLVRYFGGVPLVLEPSTGIDEEAQVPRNSVAEVYAQIAADLEEAATLLSPDGGPAHASQHAANALLARVYLEIGGDANWALAVERATDVIDNGGYELVADYGDLFAVKNNSESIFELQYTVNDNNALAFWFYPQELGGRLGFAPTQELFDAYEAGDERRDASIADLDGQRYGIKFFRIGNGNDNVTVLRLAEMYLIRAEANARLAADPADVRADIDVVRNRAGLPDLPATVVLASELIDAILQERRVEFAMEGHRFFDLRRTGRATAVLGIDEARLLFPIPQDERDVNGNLEQNPGY